MENEKIGPFNDFNLYKKIRDIYFDCFQQKKPIPYYLIKEEKGEIYLTMEECFQRLNKKFYKEIQKNIKNSGYGNTVFYPQMNFPFYFPQNNNIIINNNNIPVKTNDINPDKNKEEVKQEIKEIDPDEFFEK